MSERRELTVYQYALNFELVSVAKIPYSLLKLSFIIFFCYCFFSNFGIIKVVPLLYLKRFNVAFLHCQFPILCKKLEKYKIQCTINCFRHLQLSEFINNLMTIAYLKMLKIIFLYVLCYVIDLQTRCNNFRINTILQRLVL